MRWNCLFQLFAASCLMVGCKHKITTGDIPAVQPFSAEKYMGVWHEAARMPHWFERGMECVTAEYALRPDGSILVRNTGVKNGKVKVSTGYARQKKAGTGELEVSFFRPFYGDYRIIALNVDYTAALVTSSTKDYAWILLRDPEDCPAWLPGYVDLLKEWGFDCSRLEYPRMK